MYQNASADKVNAHTAELTNNSFVKEFIGNKILISDKSSVDFATAETGTLKGNATAKNLTIKDVLTLSGECKVNNINITGENIPQVLINDKAVVNGKIIFEKSKGTVYVNRLSDSLIKPSQIVNGELKQTQKKYGFDKVAGMKDLKQTLREDVIEPLTKPELYKKYGLSVINGFLFYGPPGCGKTYITKMLAEETGRHIVEISPSNVGSIYQHQTAENIKRKFDEARAHAPAIIFIDEIESLAPVRATLSAENPDYNEQVTELLQQMNKSSGNEILVITASNEPQKIDPAILRTGRLDKKIFVPPPDAEARAELFNMDLLNRYKENNLNISALSEKTDYYTPEDIKVVVNKAAILALKENLPISMNHLNFAIESNKPSLNEAIVKIYSDKIN